MAVDSRTTTPGPTQPLIRYLLWATAATLGVSGAAAALISAVSGFLVYQYARARGQWGTDEPPEGMAEDVDFTSALDNVRISGWFFRAAGSEIAPAVVMCHGIGTGRRECLPIALRFSAAGYNVLCFDFRAHGMSAGQFSSVGLHETNDVIGAVQYLKQRPEVDPKRIGVVGFSMGAVATIQAAAQCDDVLVCDADDPVDVARFRTRARDAGRDVPASQRLRQGSGRALRQAPLAGMPRSSTYGSIQSLGSLLCRVPDLALGPDLRRACCARAGWHFGRLTGSVQHHTLNL